MVNIFQKLTIILSTISLLYSSQRVHGLIPSVPSQPLKVETSRRHAFTSILSIATYASSVVPSVATADDQAPATKNTFVGTFADPINHPGGKRTVELIDGYQVGSYQLARVVGGGGVGEPKNYVLPAVILGGSTPPTIVIDFSPKGGPKDFVGVLDGPNGDIKFLRDGNRWPRI